MQGYFKHTSLIRLTYFTGKANWAEVMPCQVGAHIARNVQDARFELE
jgi:hypothetical protein